MSSEQRAEGYTHIRPISAGGVDAPSNRRPTGDREVSPEEAQAFMDELCKARDEARALGLSGAELVAHVDQHFERSEIEHQKRCPRAGDPDHRICDLDGTETE